MIATAKDGAPRPRVALCPLGGSVQPELAVLLSRRGVASSIATLTDARGRDVGAIAAVARSTLTKSMIRDLGPLCRDAAVAGRPVILLAPATSFSGPLERALISAHLEDSGAIVVSDPDVWLETVVLLAALGIPRGPRVALVFDQGSWLDDAAEALARERVSSRLRAVSWASLDAGDEPTDLVLCDPALLPPHRAAIKDLVVASLVGRGELVVDGSPPTLVGLRAALAAAEAAGELRLRINEGLGNASERERPEDIDFPRVEKQLAKLGRRAGDHETKVMLAAAGVAITRQAVATTASAAARLAKRAGFPVEMKPWGANVPDEISGCQVETDLGTAADARRAFAALCRGREGAVIVRQRPPAGRELSVKIAVDEALGAMMVVRVAGHRDPLAAVSPLTQFDADRLSRSLCATRVDDPEPAKDEVAHILSRASFLHRDVESMRTLALPRVVAGEREAVVVDAWAELEV